VTDERSGPDPHPPLTPGGTQAERTRLSWRRTTLAGTLAVLLIARLAIHDGLEAWAAAALAVALAAWVAFIWVTHRRIQAMAHRVPAAVGRTLPAVTAAIMLFATIGIVLVWVGGVAVKR
jgi:hypothetical protein